MSFLSSETLTKRLPVLVDPFRPTSISHGAYELHLGSEVFITTHVVKKVLQKNEQISIPPGQFALLLTEEVVSIPNDLIALISIKYRKKAQGLVNVSGFHVDPGFKGRLKFSVYNAGSQNIYLSEGAALFPIWFVKLDEPTTDSYCGEHQGQLSITDEDVRAVHGELASPAALKTQIEKLRADSESSLTHEVQKLSNQIESRYEKLEHKIGIIDRIAVAIAVAIVVMMVKFFFFDSSIQPGEAMHYPKDSAGMIDKRNPDAIQDTTSPASSSSDRARRKDSTLTLTKGARK